MELQQGTLLKENRYRIRSVIGTGGFGITYLADELFFYKWEDGLRQNKVATHRVPETIVIKELFYKEFCHRDSENRIYADDGNTADWNNLKKRMKDEGNKMNKFDHPNIAKVRNIFEENNTVYTVMDYVDGVDLERIIAKEGTLKVPRAEHYIRQVLQAVKEVHSHNIYHFDIKPSNILIEEQTDKAVLIDFGAALSYNSDGSVQTTNSTLSKIRKTQGASVPFCPIEIETGNFDFLNINESIDKPASIDLYSVGATFYYLITGKLPPSAGKMNTGKEALSIPQNLDKKITEHIRKVIVKAMETKVQHRFQDAASFLDALDDPNYFESNDDFGGETVIIAQKQTDPEPKKRGNMGMVVGILAAAAALVVGIVLFAGKKSDEAPAARGLSVGQPATQNEATPQQEATPQIRAELDKADKLFYNDATQGEATSIYKQYENYLNSDELIEFAKTFAQDDKNSNSNADPKHLFFLLYRSANKGNPEAYSVLGAVWKIGQPGFGKNVDSAFFWFSKAAYSGTKNTAPLVFLAEMYLKGDGISPNLDSAKKWYGVAAEMGDKEAARMLKKLNNAPHKHTKTADADNEY